MDSMGAERIGLEGYLGLMGWSGPVAAMMRDEVMLMRSTEDVERSFQRLGPGIGGIEQQTNKASQAFQTLGQSAQKVNSILTGVGRTLLGTGLGVTTLTGLIMGLGGEAARLQGVQAAFENMGGSLESMQAATQGLVPAKDLMENFNRAAMLVSRDFAQELPGAMAYLQQVAMATGDSMDYLLRSIVIGVGRLSPLILDNLGISIKLSDAYEEWSRKTGIATKEMSKAQQQVAVMDATMAALRRNFGDTSAATNTAAMEAMRFRTRMEELKLAVGEAMIPILNEMYPAMQNFAQAVLEFFGSADFKRSVKDAADQLAEILATLQKIQQSSPVVITIAGGLATWGLFGGLITKIYQNLLKVGKAAKWLGGILKVVFKWFSDELLLLPIRLADIGGAFEMFGRAVGYAAKAFGPLAGVMGIGLSQGKKLNEMFDEQQGVIRDITNTYEEAGYHYEAYVARVIEETRRMNQELSASDAAKSVQETLDKYAQMGEAGKAAAEAQRNALELMGTERNYAEELLYLRLQGLDATEAQAKMEAWRAREAQELIQEGRLLTQAQYEQEARNIERSRKLRVQAQSEAAWAARKYGDEIDDITASLEREAQALYDLSLEASSGGGMRWPAPEPDVVGFGELRRIETDFYNWDMGMRKDQLARLLQWQQEAENATAQHAEALLGIQKDFEQRSVEAEFQYQMDVQQATIDYQAQRAAALAYGNEEAARDLQTKHEIELEQMRINYEQQAAETERGMIEQQIVRQEAYITQLEAAKEQYLKELGMQLGQNEKFMTLGVAFQDLYFAQFAEGDAKLLKKAAEDAMAQLEISKNLNEGQLASTIQTVQGIINARNEELAAAQGNLTTMQASYEKAKAAIMAATVVTPFDPAQFKQSTAAATKAASRAGETATTKLARVASDISKAVEDAESAIWKLATFTIPEGTKAGLERLADYLVMAVEALYAGYDELRRTIKDKGMKRLAEGTQYIQTAVGIIKPAIDTLKALAEYESAADLPQRMAMFIYDLYDTVGMLGDFALSINKDWLKKVSKQVEPLAQVFSVVSPMIDAMAALADYQTGNLEEVLDVFEADIMTLLGRLGSIGARMTVEGLADAKIFQIGAQQIAAAINSGLALIQETAGELIDVNFGGAATYVPIAVNQSLAQMIGSGAPRTVSVTFGDVYLQNETDWARLETMVRQVVTEEVWA